MERRDFLKQSGMLVVGFTLSGPLTIVLSVFLPIFKIQDALRTQIEGQKAGIVIEGGSRMPRVDPSAPSPPRCRACPQ